MVWDRGSTISYLINIYVKVISRKLGNVKIECIVGDKIINHIFYADDFILLCPSRTGLQKLINICSYQGDELDILFIAKNKIVQGQWPSFWETQWDSQQVYVAFL